MGDTSVVKVMSKNSPTGEMGQKYLASGVSLAMRMWDDLDKSDEDKNHKRDYETVGYVVSGKAELHIEDQKIILEEGDSWVVPKGAKHHYEILEKFTAIEATHPPAHAHGRDEEK